MLPPGIYELHPYSNEPEAHVGEPQDDACLGDLRFEVAPGQKELDLGTIELVAKTNDGNP